MFDGHYKEKEASIIPVPNISWRVFESMMRAIYTSKPLHPQISLLCSICPLSDRQCTRDHVGFVSPAYAEIRLRPSAACDTMLLRQQSMRQQSDVQCRQLLAQKPCLRASLQCLLLLLMQSPQMSPVT